MHSPPVLVLTSSGTIFGRLDADAQLADLGVMGPMLREELTFAAGQAVQLVLPSGQIVLEIGKRMSRAGPGPAPASPPPTAPVLAAQPPHLHPQRRDGVLGPRERRERFLGAAGLALRRKSRRAHVLQPLP